MATRAACQPGLGEESEPEGEAKLIDQIVSIHREVQERVDRLEKPVPRGQHPKHHGCVRAEFVVADGLPDAYRHGLFAEPRAYKALIRFSNGGGKDDTKADIHGMAVKVLGVEGESALGGAAETQDFIMVDSPTFFVRDIADYVPFMEEFRRLKVPGFGLGKLAAIAKVLFSQDFKMFRAARKKIDSPLTTRYWSTTPYRLGPTAMKFSARPAPDTQAPATVPSSKDKLRHAMSAHLKGCEARFDFLVQLQSDAAAMPIEDPTVAWDEAASPYRLVASIVIPPQSFESDEQMSSCEDLTFTPWHALAAHRPLGGVNRSRRAIYEAISKRRHELNGRPMQEPAG